jgi:protein associated with RNAse G/E
MTQLGGLVVIFHTRNFYPVHMIRDHEGQKYIINRRSPFASGEAPVTLIR